MARKRQIKPGFFKNELLAELDPIGRIFFIGIWCYADKEGRLEDRPRKLKAEILPYDDADGEELIQQLADRNFLVRYEVQGKRYLQIVNFKKHQDPHPRESESIIPEYEREIQGAPMVEPLDDPGTSKDEASNPYTSFTPCTSCKDDVDDGAAKLVSTWEKETGKPVTPVTAQKLTAYLTDDRLPTEVVTEAMKRAVEQGQVKLAYVDGIIKNWIAAGVKTLADIDRIDRDFEEKKQTKHNNQLPRAEPKGFQGIRDYLKTIGEELPNEPG